MCMIRSHYHFSSCKLEMDLLSDPTLVSSETTKVNLTATVKKPHKAEIVEKKLRGNDVCCFLNTFASLGHWVLKVL